MGVTALNLLPHRASISLPGSQFPGAFSTSPFQICHPPPFIFLVNPSSNLAFPLFPSFSTADFNTFCCPCYLSYNLFAAFPVSPWQAKRKYLQCVNGHRGKKRCWRNERRKFKGQDALVFLRLFSLSKKRRNTNIETIPMLLNVLQFKTL